MRWSEVDKMSIKESTLKSLRERIRISKQTIKESKLRIKELEEDIIDCNRIIKRIK